MWRLREMSDHHGGADGVLSGDRRAAGAVRGPRARGAEDRRGGARAARRLLARGCRARRPAAVAPARAARRRQLRGRAAAGRRRAPAGAASASPTPGSPPSRPARSASRWARSRRSTCGSFRSRWCAPTACPRRSPICGPRRRAAELSVDLMRFGPDAPRGAMDYLFIELMLWGRQRGLPLVQSRHGAACRAWKPIRSRRPGTASATSSSATASTSITSTGCGATRRSSIRPGKRATWWRAAASRCRACWSTCRC